MQQINKQLRNFDNVESQDYERYMKAGICEFWGIIDMNNMNKDCNKLDELAHKYNYLCFSTSMLNVYEVNKIGATFEDRTRQMKNENLSVLLESA